MKIAVPYDSGKIFQNFEYTNIFKLYDIENGEIICTEIVGTMGRTGHNDLVSMLALIDIDALICGNIDESAQEMLEDEGIMLYNGCI